MNHLFRWCFVALTKRPQPLFGLCVVITLKAT